jgi:hypothetical protein
MNLQPQFEHFASDAEHEYISDRTRVLIRAINATGHREAHVGVACHALMLGLTVEERVYALSYLHDVLRRSSN